MAYSHLDLFASEEISFSASLHRRELLLFNNSQNACCWQWWRIGRASTFTAMEAVTKKIRNLVFISQIFAYKAHVTVKGACGVVRISADIQHGPQQPILKHAVRNNLQDASLGHYFKLSLHSCCCGFAQICQMPAQRFWGFFSHRSNRRLVPASQPTETDTWRCIRFSRTIQAEGDETRRKWIVMSTVSLDRKL